MANERPLTLAEARALLYSHATDDATDADGTFRSRLNEVLERIHGDGLWDGNTFRTDVSGYITDEILTLPYEFEAMIAVALAESPKNIMDEGHEFTQGGPGIQDAGKGGNLVIDLGFVEESGQLVRKYKFTMNVDSTDAVEGILKRRFTYLSSDSDLVRPSSIGALKHGLLAICFENEGDIQRSTAYWSKCYDILEKEKSNNNIGVVRTQKGNQWGFMTDKPYGMM